VATCVSGWCVYRVPSRVWLRHTLLGRFVTPTIYRHRSILRGQALFDTATPETDIGFTDIGVENVAGLGNNINKWKAYLEKVREFRKENPIFNSVLLIRYGIKNSISLILCDKLLALPKRRYLSEGMSTESLKINIHYQERQKRITENADRQNLDS
jgi:hypothetical protein